MDLPFTNQEFLDVFRTYNESIWPIQFVAILAGMLVANGLATRAGWARRVAMLTLSAMWLWNGLAYHFGHFRSINGAAILFAALFVAQGLLFAVEAYREPVQGDDRRMAWWFGWLSVIYAFVGYPLLGVAFGHAYPAMPVLGVAPCPTAIFTLGVLMILDRRAPGYLLAIPVIWALVGTSAALQLGMAEDFGLPIAALLAVGLRWAPSGQVRTDHRAGHGRWAGGPG